MKEKCCFCGAEYDTENRDGIFFKTNEGSEIKIASVRFGNRRLCICAKCLYLMFMAQFLQLFQVI